MAPMCRAEGRSGAMAVPLATRPSGGHMRPNPWPAGVLPVPTFDDRENAFENKFAHDAEMQFKAEARRNKLLGLWAAGLLGKSGDDAAAYAKEVVAADFQEAGDDDVLRKVAADLGALATPDTIRARMTELMVEAKRQLMSEV